MVFWIILTNMILLVLINFTNILTFDIYCKKAYEFN